MTYRKFTNNNRICRAVDGGIIQPGATEVENLTFFAAAAAQQKYITKTSNYEGIHDEKHTEGTGVSQPDVLLD